MNTTVVTPRVAIGDAFMDAFSGGRSDATRARQDLAFYIERTFLDQRGQPLRLQPFHHKIVHDLLFDKRVMALIPRSWGKCLEEHTPVTLYDGRTIPLREVCEGDVLLGYDPVTGAFAPTTVVFKAYSGTQEVYRLTTRMGRTLVGTTSHPIWGLGKTGLAATPMMDISSVLMPRVLPCQPSSATITPDEAILLGYWQARGRRNASTYRLTVKDPDIVAEILDIVARNHFVYDDTITGGVTHHITIYGLKNFSPQDVVPRLIFSQPNDIIALFLNRYFSTTAWIGTTNNAQRFIHATSTTREVALGIQALLLRLGVVSRVNYRAPQPPREKPTWRVAIEARSHIAFAERVGCYTPKRAKALAAIAKAAPYANPTPFSYDDVASIEPAGVGRTYDLQLSPHHLFVAGSLIVSNSTICCVAYPSWRLGNNRDLRIIIASNTEGQAKRWLADIENVMLRNGTYHETFGYLVPKARSLLWTDTEKVVLGRSAHASHVSLKAVGLGSGVLGARADILIIDDLVGPQEARSRTMREAASRWLWSTLMPTLEPDGQTVVTGSRWAKDDLYAEILERWQGAPQEIASWQRPQRDIEGAYPSYSTLQKLEEAHALDPHALKDLTNEHRQD